MRAARWSRCDDLRDVWGARGAQRWGLGGWRSVGIFKPESGPLRPTRQSPYGL
jgi:hypothetical protein